MTIPVPSLIPRARFAPRLPDGVQEADPRLLADATKAFRRIDVDGHGSISLEAVEDFCLEVFDDVYGAMSSLPRRVKDDLYNFGLKLQEEVRPALLTNYLFKKL